MKLGLDLKGGVHLVLRVQTDDALRLETETTSSSCARRCKTRGHHRQRPSPRGRRPVSRSRACRRPGRRVPPARPTTIDATYDRDLGRGGTYTLHDEAEHRAELRERR